MAKIKEKYNLMALKQKEEQDKKILEWEKEALTLAKGATSDTEDDAENDAIDSWNI